MDRWALRHDCRRRQYAAKCGRNLSRAVCDVSVIRNPTNVRLSPPWQPTYRVRRTQERTSSYRPNCRHQREKRAVEGNGVNGCCLRNRHASAPWPMSPSVKAMGAPSDELLPPLSRGPLYPELATKLSAVHSYDVATLRIREEYKKLGRSHVDPASHPQAMTETA